MRLALWGFEAGACVEGGRVDEADDWICMPWRGDIGLSMSRYDVGPRHTMVISAMIEMIETRAVAAGL